MEEEELTDKLKNLLLTELISSKIVHIRFNPGINEIRDETNGVKTSNVIEAILKDNDDKRFNDNGTILRKSINVDILNWQYKSLIVARIKINR